MSNKIMNGVVTSLSGKNTVAVQISRMVKHSRYHKYIRISKKFLADDSLGSCKVGDAVEICSVRPISKRKKWAIVYRSSL